MMHGVEGLTDENGNPTFNPETNLPNKGSDDEDKMMKQDVA